MSKSGSTQNSQLKTHNSKGGVEIHVQPPPLLVAVRHINRDRKCGLRIDEQASTICCVKTADTQVAGMRRHLSFVEEKAPVHHSPDAIAILCGQRQSTLVTEPEVSKSAQRLPWSEG